MAPKKPFQQVAAALKAQRRVIVAYVRRRAEECRQGVFGDPASLDRLADELEAHKDEVDPLTLYRDLVGKTE